VSDMGEQQREEVDSEGRPSLEGGRIVDQTRGWQRLVRWGRVRLRTAVLRSGAGVKPERARGRLFDEVDDAVMFGKMRRRWAG
jgi:hypothetical protein